MFEFIQSLGPIGYIFLGFVFLLIINLKKLIKLRSPLDSQQHINWRATGGQTKPDHLPTGNGDAFGGVKTRKNPDDKG